MSDDRWLIFLERRRIPLPDDTLVAKPKFSNVGMAVGIAALRLE